MNILSLLLRAKCKYRASCIQFQLNGKYCEGLNYPKYSLQNKLCISPIVCLDFRDKARHSRSQGVISCLGYFVAGT